MNWTAFWPQFTDLMGIIQSVISCIPSMILDIVFAVLSFSAVWVLVKLIREVRS